MYIQISNEVQRMLPLQIGMHTLKMMYFIKLMYTDAKVFICRAVTKITWLHFLMPCLVTQMSLPLLMYTKLMRFHLEKNWSRVSAI